MFLMVQLQFLLYIIIKMALIIFLFDNFMIALCVYIQFNNTHTGTNSLLLVCLFVFITRVVQLWKQPSRHSILIKLMMNCLLEDSRW